MILHNTLPEPTSIVFPGQRTCTPTATRRSRSSTSGGADLAGAAADARRSDPGSVTYDVHRRVARHLPLLVRHRRQQAAPDGPLRRARRAARRSRRTRSTTAADSAFNPDHEYLYCSPRSTRTCTWPSSASEPFDYHGVQRPLLPDQRPQHAGHPRAEQRGVAARTSRTARWCTSSRTTRAATRCRR